MKEISLKKAQAQTIIISFLVIVLLSGALYSYILPKRNALALEIEAANTLKDRLDKLIKDGPLKTDIRWFSSLKNLDPTDRDRFASIIVKPVDVSVPYKTWVSDEKSRYESADVSSEIARREEFITSIIPTISSVSSSAGEMTLTDYVRLIEVRWLSKYRLHSTSNIGFDGMQAVSATGGIKNAVLLPVNLEIRGLSKDIYSFVEFINTAGTLPDINSSTWSSVLETKTLLSSPLVRITWFVPSEVPRVDDTSEITATLQLSLYLRSPSAAQYGDFLSRLKERSYDIHGKITKALVDHKDDSAKLVTLNALERELTSLDGQIQNISILPSSLAETSLDNQISDVSRAINSLSLRVDSVKDSGK